MKYSSVPELPGNISEEWTITIDYLYPGAFREVRTTRCVRGTANNEQLDMSWSKVKVYSRTQTHRL